MGFSMLSVVEVFDLFTSVLLIVCTFATSSAKRNAMSDSQK